jgi:hypothetical protein
MLSMRAWLAIGLAGCAFHSGATATGDAEQRDADKRDAARDSKVVHDTKDASHSAGFVQGAQLNDQTTDETQAQVAFTATETAGDANVVAVAWAGNVGVTTVTDNFGDTYTQVGAPVSGWLHQAMYYAVDIAPGAGPTTVTVTLSGAAQPLVMIAEYAGVDSATALDVSAGSSGQSTSADSGSVTTTHPHDLLVAVSTYAGGSVTAGPNFTIEVSASPFAVLEDREVLSSGAYDAAVTLGTNESWVIQLAALAVAN